MIDQLIFDTTDANTIADSHSVGAYVRSSDGTLITHTNDAVNSKDRLDVLSVLADAAGNAVGVSSGSLDVNVTNTLGIDVDLDQSEDSVAIGDGTTLFDAAVEDVAAVAGHAGFASMAIQDAALTSLTSVDGDFTHIRVNASGALWTEISNSSVTVDDGSGSLTVDAVDLDIRDLTHASDSVRLGDGTTLTTVTTVGSDNGLDIYNLNDPSTADTAIANASNDLGVANTAEDVVASPLANRKVLFIRNNGNRRVFIGSTGVTSANGFPLTPGSVLELKAGPSIDIEWVGPNTNQQIRTLELS